jgi:hypothetical protein
MSNVPRSANTSQLARTFSHNVVEQTVQFAPQGTSAPLIVWGDAAAGFYFTITRTGVGTYTLKTNQAYPSLPARNGIVPIPALCGSISLATPVGQWSLVPSNPTHNADGTWTMPFTLLLVNTATDIAAATGNIINLYIDLPMDLLNP